MLVSSANIAKMTYSLVNLEYEWCGNIMILCTTGFRSWMEKNVAVAQRGAYATSSTKTSGLSRMPVTWNGLTAVSENPAISSYAALVSGSFKSCIRQPDPTSDKHAIHPGTNTRSEGRKHKCFKNAPHKAQAYERGGGGSVSNHLVNFIQESAELLQKLCWLISMIDIRMCGSDDLIISCSYLLECCIRALVNQTPVIKSLPSLEALIFPKIRAHPTSFQQKKSTYQSQQRVVVIAVCWDYGLIGCSSWERVTSGSWWCDDFFRMSGQSCRRSNSLT